MKGITVSFNTQIGSYNDIRKFIQKENYEPYLCKILRASRFFEDDLVIIDKQNNGQDDYYSQKSENSYEATLILPENTISELKKGFQIWNDLGFQERIFKKAKDDVIKILNKKISKKKKNIILLNIFPFRQSQFSAETFYNSVYAQHALCSTWKQLIIEIQSIIPDGISIYIVSYNPDNTFYIEELCPNTSNKKEYICRLNKDDGFPFYSEILPHHSPF